MAIFLAAGVGVHNPRLVMGWRTMVENKCYCCGNPGEPRQIRQGLWCYLCSECDGAKIDKRGFVCPKHGRPTPVDVVNVQEPLSYPVVCKSGGKFFGLVRYDERKV